MKFDDILANILFFGGFILFLFIIYLVFPQLFIVFFSKQFLLTVHILYLLFPLWGPPLFAFGAYVLWVEYIRAKFLAKQKYVLLELKLPPEVYKSPLAMELVLHGLYITSGETTWWDTHILGKTRPWCSLEITSFEGKIHFYIWTREGYRPVVESQFYGQYPNIEIYEVPDYTGTFWPYDNEKMFLGGQEYGFSKPDVYPIKTYVDYGLDKDPKEEFKVDPLTSIIEYLSTLGRGEQIWIQIMIQAHKVKRKEGTFFEKTDIQKEAKAEIKKLLADLKEKTPTSGDDGGFTYSRIPTKTEAEVMAAIDRAAGKLNFDCGIRLIYAATREKFQGVRIPHTLGIMRPFATKHLNSFSTNWSTYFDWPWSDFMDIRATYRKRLLYKAYRLRSYFHGPVKHTPIVMSSEELATIFHPLGSILQTAAVSRVTSKKAAAPANLPE